jgi:hypothetical protein
MNQYLIALKNRFTKPVPSMFLKYKYNGLVSNCSHNLILKLKKIMWPVSSIWRFNIDLVEMRAIQSGNLHMSSWSVHLIYLHSVFLLRNNPQMLYLYLCENNQISSIKTNRV